MNVIDRAIEHIGRVGWCQHELRDDKGRVCALGAIRAAHPLNGVVSLYRFPETALLQSVCEQETGREMGAFNDDPSTSLEDVLLVLKKASARLDEEAAS